MVPFNSEFAAWAPEGSVSLEPSSDVLVPFNSEFAVWTPDGSVSLKPPGEFWFRLIQSLLRGLWKVL